jgi:hypothetical protein
VSAKPEDAVDQWLRSLPTGLLEAPLYANLKMVVGMVRQLRAQVGGLEGRARRLEQDLRDVTAERDALAVSTSQGCCQSCDGHSCD